MRLHIITMIFPSAVGYSTDHTYYNEREKCQYETGKPKTEGERVNHAHSLVSNDYDIQFTFRIAMG